MWAAAFLVGLHFLAVTGGFLAPYDFAAQDRRLPFAPPTSLHFFDTRGRFHLRPFVYRLVDRLGDASYEEDQSQPYPLRFFVADAPYSVAGLFVSRTHLFGVDEPARLFLLGSDGFGRDQFSRLLHGAQVSLFAGLLAAALALGTGFCLGALAGFYGGRLDALLMRLAELFLALPWLYLLLAVRAFLPLGVGPRDAFLLLILLIGLIDWARPARLVRGVVLSAKERDYVLAARGFGASDSYVLRRHVLPQAFGVVLTQAALSIPQYILAEVTLSFLGLGIGEPWPSWGNMLAALQQYHVLASRWWMFLPGIALMPVFFAYHVLAEDLRARAD